jgi:hypothetical protein
LLFRLTIIFAAVLLPEYVAYACTCVRRGAACEVFQQTPLVFLGTVTDAGPSVWNLSKELLPKLTPAQNKRLEDGEELSLEEAKAMWARMLPKDARAKLKRVHGERELNELLAKYYPVLVDRMRPVKFRVQEMFRGELSEIEQIWTGQGFGDCGYDFHVGESYLVYAHKDPETGRMTTGICTRTAPAADAIADLDYLQSVRLGTAKSWVSGYVTSGDQQRTRAILTGNPPSSPIGGATVELESATTTRTATTDAQGRFTFEGLAEGDYQIYLSAEGHLFRPSPNSFHIARFACSVQYFSGERVTVK